MKSTLFVIFLISQIALINAGITSSKPCVEALSEKFSQLTIQSDAADLVPELKPLEKAIPLDAFNYIVSWLPGNHPLLLQLAYNGGKLEKKGVRVNCYKLPDHAVEKIVKAFKKSCVKALRHHEFKAEWPAIVQPTKFRKKKKDFLTKLELFFTSCPALNKSLINSKLQENVRKLYSAGVIALPMNIFEVAHIPLPQEIKQLHEKAVLVAVAKSRDKESQTATIIYDYKRLHSFDDEYLLLRKLLPSVNWQSDSIKTCPIGSNSPYFF